jgi:hypothetical protein
VQSPDRRSPAQKLAGAKQLSAIGSVHMALVQAFSDSFGGLYNSNGQTAFVVQIVHEDDREGIQAFIDDYLRQRSPDAPSPNSPGWPTTISFERVSHPLNDLLELRDQIVNERSAWEARSMPFVGVGINDILNAVVVTPYMTVSKDEIRGQLRRTYSTDAIETAEPSDFPHLTAKHS